MSAFWTWHRQGGLFIGIVLHLPKKSRLFYWPQAVLQEPSEGCLMDCCAYCKHLTYQGVLQVRLHSLQTLKFHMQLAIH